MRILSTFLYALLFLSCSTEDGNTNHVAYFINLDQFSESKDLSDIDRHLPRLTELGVDLLVLALDESHDLHQLKELEAQCKREGIVLIPKGNNQLIEAFGAASGLAGYQENDSEVLYLENETWKVDDAFAFALEEAADEEDLAKRLTDLNRNRINYTTSDQLIRKDGYVFDRFGKLAKQNIALAYLLPGIPMIYNGEEVGLGSHRERTLNEPIIWGDHPFNSMYARLGKLKRNHPALNGSGTVSYTASPNLLFVERTFGESRILGVFNRTDGHVVEEIKAVPGDYRRFNARDVVTLGPRPEIQLNPYGFELFVR